MFVFAHLGVLLSSASVKVGNERVKFALFNQQLDSREISTVGRVVQKRSSVLRIVPL